MTNPNWGLLNAGQGFQNALSHGYQLGTDARVRREKTEYNNALATVLGGPSAPVLRNPDNPTVPNEGNRALPGDDQKRAALAIVAQQNPQLYMQIQEREAQDREARQVGELTQKALAGDQDAMAQLATVNFDRWKSLDDNQRAATKAKAEVLGGAAMDVLNRPPEQRQAAVMAYAQQLGQQYPGIAQLAQLPPAELEAALRGAVAEAGMVGKMIEMERPDYMAVPYDATLVNTRDPASLQQFGQGAPQQSPAVPPAAVEALRRGEGTPEQFDEMFGPGAAARIMGNGGAGASRIGSNFLDGL